MDLKDILAIVDGSSGGDHVIKFAEQLAEQRSGRVSGLVMGWRPAIASIPEAWVVESRIEQLINDLKRTLAADLETVRRRFDRDLGAGVAESLFIDPDEAFKMIGLRARHADLSIVSRTRPTYAETANVVIEACLFGSGRPVIVVPPVWKPARIGRTILISWKPTKEASRALADAGPLIACADRVVVATVDAVPSETGYGETPGADICAHLARCGASVELINVASGGRSQAGALEGQALAVGADLIVMGGYGRSRLSELVLGGVTRDMLRTSSLPILMAH